ncbi:MAG: hypothetical protein M3Y21_04550 [Candidatus Eremiobacteraeota bacterium]|nr:hypothetical protein [Candidatus Eremiobacteraeota bacterium]
MPLYDYQCSQCSKITEVRHGFDEPHTGVCPACGGPLTRLFNPAGIVFKGSGFYITDSRKSESKSEPKASDSKPSESKSSDSKPSTPAPSAPKSSDSAA